LAGALLVALVLALPTPARRGGNQATSFALSPLVIPRLLPVLPRAVPATNLTGQRHRSSTFLSHKGNSSPTKVGPTPEGKNGAKKSSSSCFHFRPGQVRIAVKTVVAGLALLLSTTVLIPPVPAAADGGSRVVGQLQGSGLVFKDTLTIESFEDPKVRGVTLYVSNFQRPITERLTSAKNFLQE